MRKFICALAIIALLLNLTLAQAGRQAGAKKGNQKTTQEIQPAAASTVTGGGTPGRISRWASPTSIGDSGIVEDKNGKIGIGTELPTSKLTVAGVIESSLGGFKFPDGTVQPSAFSAEQVVSSLNGLKGNVTLAQGANIAITPSGNTLTIAATGVLTGVTHDSTLSGDGTAAQPLGLAVPLLLTGEVSTGNGVITVTNSAAGSPAIFAVGGNSGNNIGGGSGLLSLGGTGTDAPGGVGIVSFGGSANGGSGGTGGSLIGGVSTNGSGGDGLFAVGALGVGTGNKGGRGIIAIPGGGAGGATIGLAGEFIGDVEIDGNLAKGGGSFKIDHPLDPENKYLYHSFVESPDMMNIYNGNVTTGADGEAVVQLPDYFGALNKEFRYQLTVIGTFAQAIVAEKINGNRFRIKTSAPNVEVSWQVTGIRQDAYANKNRIKVEEEKNERERGFYLHPDLFNQPEERGVKWARNPEMMQRVKESRSKQLEK